MGLCSLVDYSSDAEYSHSVYESDGEEDKQYHDEPEELTLPRSRRKFYFSSTQDLESSDSDGEQEEDDQQEEKGKVELTLPGPGFLKFTCAVMGNRGGPHCAPT